MQKEKLRKVLRETFKMELSNVTPLVHSHLTTRFISLQKYSILENGTVLKYLSASTSFVVSSSKHLICCFLTERVKLLVKVRKRLLPIFYPKHLTSPFQLLLGILLVCYTMGRHCKGSSTDSKIKKSKVFFLFFPQPTPKKIGWMKQYVRGNIPVSSVRR